MKIQTKLAAGMTLVLMLFCGAIATAMLGMQHTQARFEAFLARDLALQQAVTGMYADGLQAGQALRNIVLDPNNRTAYANLEAAAKSYRENSRVALDVADPADAQVLQEIGALHEKLAPLQARIAANAAADAAAAAKATSQEETPLWRGLRGRLLEFRQAKKAAVERTKEEMASFNGRLRLVTLVAALAAAAIGAAVSFWLVRHLAAQLGGEPAYAAEVARGIAAGNLTHRIEVSDGHPGSMLFAMRSMQQELAALVGRIRNATQSIATASGEIAAGNQDLSQRTEEQASSLEETAAAMEQLTGTVKQNAENARHANQLAQSAAEVATQGGAVVGEVVQTMSSINEASRKVVDIIGVIDGIAFQTNILALNAAVEAARAGEQGRGFAVVAAEVRALAQRSATAAREIKTLIDDSVDKVDAGTQLVARAGQTMEQVVEGVRRVTDIMGEIAAASSEQTRGIEQVSLAIAQMDQVTQQNAALVEEASAAAQSMREQAGDLVQAVSVFRVREQPTAGEAAPPALPVPADRPHSPAVERRARPALIASTRQPALAAPSTEGWTAF